MDPTGGPWGDLAFPLGFKMRTLVTTSFHGSSIDISNTRGASMQHDDKISSCAIEFDR